MAKGVDGVYDDDLGPTSGRALRPLDLRRRPARDLKVADATAISLCRTTRCRLSCSTFSKATSPERAGERIGTLVSSETRSTCEQRDRDDPARGHREDGQPSRWPAGLRDDQDGRANATMFNKIVWTTTELPLR